MKRRWILIVGVVVLLAVVPMLVGFGGGQGQHIDQFLSFLGTREWVDLTHTLEVGIPMPDGLPIPTETDYYGGAVQQWTLVGQTGTHLDAPGHFHPGMALVDDIAVKDLMLKGCVIDISAQAAANPDYRLQLADVKAWEKANGPIPKGSLVILRTDWSKRWPDATSFFNKDASGVNHYPGWGEEALHYLVEKRNIAAIAHETPDTDSGATALAGPVLWPLEDYFLGTGRWQIENLANVDQLPTRGFMVMVGLPKIGDGTGFPVRVTAILP